MESLQVGNIGITRIVELVGPNSHRFTQALFPALTEERLAPQREWLTPNYIDPETGRLVMSMHCFVVRTKHHTILVDTCIGNHKKRGMRIWNDRDGPFLEDLARAGVRPDDVDFVLCTHLHVDHVGWNTHLVNGRWVPTFPKAKYLFEQTEWDYWKDHGPDDTGDVVGDSIRPVVDAGLVEFFSGEHAVNDEMVTMPTPGHTPGHCSVRLASRGEEAMITGDMIHHPFQCADPELESSFDWNQEMARTTRRAFLEQFSDTSTRILGTHFSGPPVTRIVEKGGTFRLQVVE